MNKDVMIGPLKSVKEQIEEMAQRLANVVITRLNGPPGILEAYHAGYVWEGEDDKKELKPKVKHIINLNDAGDMTGVKLNSFNDKETETAQYLLVRCKEDYSTIRIKNYADFTLTWYVVKPLGWPWVKYNPQKYKTDYLLTTVQGPNTVKSGSDGLCALSPGEQAILYCEVLG